MLKYPGSIPWETLHSQDGLNLGDVHFCPIRRTLCMQCISLDHLQKLITEGVFMPPDWRALLKSAGLLPSSWSSRQTASMRRSQMSMLGLIVRRVESHLYTPDQILDFVKDIEVDLQAACDAIKAGGDPGKKHTFCLFVSNFGGAMSIPMDLPYCLVYPTSYVRDTKPDHFVTCNNLVGTCLHCCIYQVTLQFTNDDPKQLKNYARSHLILSHGAHYNDWLFPMILKPQNHQGLLIDSVMKEPFPMELVGSADRIFKGCYGDSLLYSDSELCQLRWWGIHLPAYQGEIPMLLAPS